MFLNDALSTPTLFSFFTANAGIVGTMGFESRNELLTPNLCQSQ